MGQHIEPSVYLKLFSYLKLAKLFTYFRIELIITTMHNVEEPFHEANSLDERVLSNARMGTIDTAVPQHVSRRSNER